MKERNGAARVLIARGCVYMLQARCSRAARRAPARTRVKRARPMNAFQILTTFAVVLVMVVFMVQFLYARWNAPCPECDARMSRDLYRSYDADEVRREQQEAAAKADRARAGAPAVDVVKESSGGGSDLSDSDVSDVSDSDLSDTESDSDLSD